MTSPRIVKLSGREGNTLIGRDGTPLDTFALYEVIKPLFGVVKECQFLQTKKGEVCVMVVSMDNKKKMEVVNLLTEKLSKYFRLKIFFVRRIKRSRSGKFRFIDSTLNTNYYNLQNFDIPSTFNSPK
jgi:hypothetical protein